MLFFEKKVCLKDGKEALLRSPTRDDAEALIAYLKATAGETDFLLRAPNEVTVTKEQEISFLESVNASSRSVMICAFLNDELAGNCQLSSVDRKKVAHVGEIALAIRKPYWGLGLGTVFMREMEETAKGLGITRLELEVIEGNERAMSLYAKCGFQTYALRSDAFCLSGGKFVNGILMEKRL